MSSKKTNPQHRLAAASNTLRENQRAVQRLLDTLSNIGHEDHGEQRKRLYTRLAGLAAADAKVFYPIARSTLM